MSLRFAPTDAASVPLHLVAKDGVDELRSTLTGAQAAWFDANGFTAGFAQTLPLPNAVGNVDCVVIGLGTTKDQARKRFLLGAVRGSLPVGTYHLANHDALQNAEAEYLGWLLAGYKFTKYKDGDTQGAELVAPADSALATRLEAIAAGEVLTRDLINTPAEHMGPGELAAATKALAVEHDANCTVIEGQALLDQNFPMIHTVGRAADRAPRLIEMNWGTSGPKLTLVGKGVCFDTGGLNLKPGGSMGLMKKDMGGAAAVLGLARMIMSLNLPLQLRVLIPAVENAVSGNSFRPGDVLTSRKGLTVEINNTDAEGRLVLADALALAAESDPDLIISMATLTGAARVAVGPDLAPFYTDSDAHAAALSSAADKAADPVWRMPFHAPYEAMIEPGIADLDNAPSGGFAGSITAALFLRRFVEDTPYMHFDIYGWQPSPAPARPKGGVGQGARALLEALPEILDL